MKKTKKTIIAIISLLAISSLIIGDVALFISQNNQENFYTDEENTIKIFNLFPHDTVKNPLKIEGEALSSWFFEGTFPVKLVDENNNLLGSSTADFIGDTWMKEGYISFESTINFTLANEKNGYLILELSNPSGLVENEKTVSIPINF